MSVCYSCNNELPERGLHCRKCGVRAKCGNCRALLEAGDEFCVECGTAVDAPALPNGSTAIEKRNKDFNVITYNDRTSNFSAQLSDNAFESGTEFLTLFVADRMGKQVKRTRQMASDDFVDAGNSMDMEGVLEDDGMAPLVPVRPALPTGNAELQRLRDVFDEKNGVLMPIENRLKQKNQRDYVRRLTVLFLYAHDLMGRDRVPRASVTALFDAAKVNDGNARKWLSGGEMTVLVGEDIKLNNHGRDSAKKFLAALDDESIPEVPVSSSKRSKSKSEPKGEGEKPTRRKVRGTSFRARITELIAEGWFAERRTSTQVQVELERRGSHFEMRRLNEALKDNTVNKILDREKIGDAWEYWKP
jgi:hypothetical protein